MRCRQILPALALLALSHTAFADDLPRHGIIGLTVATPEPNKPANAKTNPPTVEAVAPGSAGEAAGVRVGDVLLALDGRPVTSATEFAAAIGRHLAGQQVALALRRNGQQIAVTAVLKPRPLETSAFADVIYDSVVVEGARTARDCHSSPCAGPPSCGVVAGRTRLLLARRRRAIRHLWHGARGARQSELCDHAS